MTFPNSASSVSIPSSKPFLLESAHELFNSSHYSSSPTGVNTAFGSVLDQLHAEQKSTIEALTYQVQFYRQREERSRKEADTLRTQLLAVECDQDVKSLLENIASMTEENRKLGEKMDNLRVKEEQSQQEERELKSQLESVHEQLREARSKMTGFQNAMEQLELKVQRKEAQVQTQWMSLEQDARTQKLESERWQQEANKSSQKVYKLEKELEALRKEYDLLRDERQKTQTERDSDSSRYSRELESLRAELADCEVAKRNAEAELIQSKVTVTAEHSKMESALRENKNELDRVKEALERSNGMLSLHEKLLSTDENRLKESESSRQDLIARIAVLEQENKQWNMHRLQLQRDLERAQSELKSTKVRLSSRDDNVMKTTLKTELQLLKDRMRLEIKAEKEEIKRQKEQLECDLASVNDEVRDKVHMIGRLEVEIHSRDVQIKSMQFEGLKYREKLQFSENEIGRLEAQFLEYKDCRTSIFERLDNGFRELLDDEDNLEAVKQEVLSLRKANAEFEVKMARNQNRIEMVEREKQHIKTQLSESIALLQSKLEATDQQLQAKEEEISQLKHFARRVALMEKEKLRLEEEVATYQSDKTRLADFEHQRLKHVQNQLQQKENEKQDLYDRLLELQHVKMQDDCALKEAKRQVQERELEKTTALNETERLEKVIHDLEATIEQARVANCTMTEEKSAREKKLLQERKEMQTEMQELIRRIEAVGKRNLELGNKVTKLLQQSKSDRAQVLALNATIKNNQSKLKRYEKELSDLQAKLTKECQAKENTERTLHQVRCLKDTYQHELSQLRATEVNRPDMSREILERERDQALERINTLLKCQDQMKETAEKHTTQLITEIEHLQQLLKNERKRCETLLSNEQALLHDLQQRTAATEKLEHAYMMLRKERVQERRSISIEPASSDPGTLISPDADPRNESPLSSPTESTRSPHESLIPRELSLLLANLEKMSESTKT
uniref:Myosinlike protein putative n=1 Tax=Albugo laibachii Nc14 TaxID=890382 RepID=F0W893_9STRA|nr:myosinlike protein putative [Albugo laibachii Nc14]|eukprot:CCA17293.1 myosinlike protein putative [Albugo laibachii Nc14]